METFKPTSKKMKLGKLLEIAAISDADLQAALRRSPKDLSALLKAK